MKKKGQEPLLKGRGLSEFTFPNQFHMPAELFKFSRKTLITCLIAKEFCPPEFGILFGPRLSLGAVMPMPEAAVDQNHKTLITQDEVGAAGEAPDLHFIGETPAIEKLLNLTLGAGIASLDAAHVLQPLRVAHHIAHGNSLWRLHAGLRHPGQPEWCGPAHEPSGVERRCQSA